MVRVELKFVPDSITEPGSPASHQFGGLVEPDCSDECRLGSGLRGYLMATALTSLNVV